MARPLPEDRIKKMDLPVKIYNGETKKLGKQIGVARYIIDEQTHEAVNLSETADKRGDGLLILEDHGKDKPVIKIVENLFHTKDKPYAYVLDKDGKVVFLEKDVSVYDTNTDAKSNKKIQEEIDKREPGKDANIDSYSGNLFEINNPYIANSATNMNVNKPESGEDPNVANYGIKNEGTMTLSFNTDATMGSSAISTTGDPASTTIQGGKN